MLRGQPITAQNYRTQSYANRHINKEILTEITDIIDLSSAFGIDANVPLTDETLTDEIKINLLNFINLVTIIGRNASDKYFQQPNVQRPTKDQLVQYCMTQLYFKDENGANNLIDLCLHNQQHLAEVKEIMNQVFTFSLHKIYLRTKSADLIFQIIKNGVRDKSNIISLTLMNKYFIYAINNETNNHTNDDKYNQIKKLLNGICQCQSNGIRHELSLLNFPTQVSQRDFAEKIYNQKFKQKDLLILIQSLNPDKFTDPIARSIIILAIDENKIKVDESIYFKFIKLSNEEQLKFACILSNDEFKKNEYNSLILAKALSLINFTYPNCTPVIYQALIETKNNFNINVRLAIIKALEKIKAPEYQFRINIKLFKERVLGDEPEIQTALVNYVKTIEFTDYHTELSFIPILKWSFNKSHDIRLAIAGWINEKEFTNYLVIYKIALILASKRLGNSPKIKEKLKQITGWIINLIDRIEFKSKHQFHIAEFIYSHANINYLKHVISRWLIPNHNAYQQIIQFCGKEEDWKDHEQFGIKSYNYADDNREEILIGEINCTNCFNDFGSHIILYDRDGKPNWLIVLSKNVTIEAAITEAAIINQIRTPFSELLTNEINPVIWQKKYDFKYRIFDLKNPIDGYPSETTILSLSTTGVIKQFPVWLQKIITAKEFNIDEYSAKPIFKFVLKLLDKAPYADEEIQKQYKNAVISTIISRGDTISLAINKEEDARIKDIINAAFLGHNPKQENINEEILTSLKNYNLEILPSIGTQLDKHNIIILLLDNQIVGALQKDSNGRIIFLEKNINDENQPIKLEDLMSNQNMCSGLFNGYILTEYNNYEEQLNQFWPALTTFEDKLKLAFLLGQIAKRGSLGYHLDINNDATNKANDILYSLCKSCIAKIKAETINNDDIEKPFKDKIDKILKNLKQGICIEAETNKLIIEECFKKYKIDSVWDKNKIV